jgi:DNA-binding transcriptional LysR family regulator
MNLRGIDLNLLVILHALLEECHVSRAAKRLHLSQPATSAALERARHLFADPLLERHAGRMVLTPKAKALKDPLRLALENLGGLLGPEPPLPKLTRTINLFMADALCAGIGGRLYRELQQSAPGLALAFHPWTGSENAVAAIERGILDIALTVMPGTDSALIRCKHLAAETYSVVMREGHPAAADFTLERWLEYPHVIVSAHGHRHSHVDQALAAASLKREVGIVVPSFLLVPHILYTSDHIALLPTLCLGALNRDRVVTFEPPMKVDGFDLFLMWAARIQDDAATEHVVDTISRLTMKALEESRLF